MVAVAAFAALAAGRAGNNQSNLTLNEFSRHRRQSIVLIVGPASFDHHVAALYIAAITQALMERTHLPRPPAGRRATKQPDHRHCWLLRSRRKRPRRRCATNKRYELAP
jgi:hypothetical protein